MGRAVILAGPNGAGKSTVAEQLIGRALGIEYFVNADTLALGLARFNPWQVRARARSVHDDWLAELLDESRDFAFETTLASGRWPNWIDVARHSGAEVQLFFVWIRSADLAVARVAHRVAAGGHDVPEDAVRGRYAAGVRNLITSCVQRVDRWTVFDNSGWPATIVAEGRIGEQPRIVDAAAWALIQQEARADDLS